MVRLTYVREIRVLNHCCPVYCGSNELILNTNRFHKVFCIVFKVCPMIKFDLILGYLVNVLSSFVVVRNLTMGK